MPYRTTLTSVDRWRVQNSDTITVSVAELGIRIKQQVCRRIYAALNPMEFNHQGIPATTLPELSSASQPRLLDAARVGVGACLWDSSFVLTAFLSKTLVLNLTA